MSRIKALDEITAALGPPASLRWVNAPYGASAAVVRLQHRGAVIDLSASRAFRLIFQLSSTQVLRGDQETPSSPEQVPAGSVNTSFTQRPERIRIVGSADTLHLLFSPEFEAACTPAAGNSLSHMHRELQAFATQTFVASSFGGTEAKLEQAVASIARLVIEGQQHNRKPSGGLAPHARQAMLDLLQKRLRGELSVPELADAAHLSLHHFIKACRQSEGLTPHALLTHKRIARSIELLLRCSTTVDEIAVQIGFSSSSHFISTFRRHLGVTPASLQRAARR